MPSRGEDRHDISIIGRIRTGLGARDVTILDLSTSGCRFHDRFGRLRAGDPLTIKIGPIGPIDSSVEWRNGEYVGASFADRLHPAVLDHIRTYFDLRKRN